VFIDDTITARVTVVECLEKRRYRLRTEVFRQDGQLVLEGEALVIAGHSEERR